MKSITAALFLACLWSGLWTAPALADNPTMGTTNPQVATPATIPPIILDGCKIEYSGGLLFGSTGKLDVEFTNESGVTADLVRIRVDLMDNVTNVRDVGTFSPGISIKHKVRNEEGQALVFPFFGGRPRLNCSIVMVHFTDGSAWVSPTLVSAESVSSDPQ